MPIVASGFRKRVVPIAQDVCDQHLREGDPLQVEITEGRKDWHDENGNLKSYSWCGDTVTWIYARAGCNEPKALNRIETAGKWLPGDNIDRLVSWAQKHEVAYGGPRAAAYLPMAKAGDVIVLDRPNGGHVGLFKQLIDGSSFITFDGNTMYDGEQGRTAENVRNEIPVWILDADCFAPSEMWDTDGESTSTGSLVAPKQSWYETSPSSTNTTMGKGEPDSVYDTTRGDCDPAMAGCVKSATASDLERRILAASFFGGPAPVAYTSWTAPRRQADFNQLVLGLSNVLARHKANPWNVSPSDLSSLARLISTHPDPPVYPDEYYNESRSQEAPLSLTLTRPWRFL